MEKWSKVINYIVFLVIGFTIGYAVKPNPVITSPKTDEVKQDSIIRDSIYIINDSITEKIIYLEKEYDKEVSTVMSNSDSVNYCLFSRYIENYKRTIENK